MKLKSFCTAKETINKTKRQPTDWEKIFAYHKYSKGFVSRVYKEFSKLKNKKTNYLTKKWAKDLNRHFIKEYIPMGNKYKKRCSIIIEMQIKTTMRYKHTLTRTTKNKYWPY